MVEENKLVGISISICDISIPRRLHCYRKPSSKIIRIQWNEVYRVQDYNSKVCMTFMDEIGSMVWHVCYDLEVWYPDISAAPPPPLTVISAMEVNQCPSDRTAVTNWSPLILTPKCVKRKGYVAKRGSVRKTPKKTQFYYPLSYCLHYCLQ
jgi:hypothetical protein